jgi:CRP/FNR family transcriptional regulator
LPFSLSPHEIAQVDKLVKHSHALRRGDFLFRSGEEFTMLYAVRAGSFKLFTYTEEGSEQILGFYFPGEIIGFDAINDNRHSSSALALETSGYCALPFARLEELSMAIPKLQHRVLQLMSKEITHENELMTMLCNKNAEEKVGSFLISLSTRFSQLGYSSTSFKLAMSRQDIGNYLGLTVETVSRILGRFQKDNIIAINNKSVELLDMDQLFKASMTCNDNTKTGSCTAS